MLDARYIRENLDTVEARLKTRGEGVDIGLFKELDEKRRELLLQSETLKALRNKVSEEIPRLKDKSQAEERKTEMREVSQRIKAIDESLRGVEEELQNFLLTVPNIPHPTTPVGKSEADNVVVRSWGEVPSFPFAAKPHWDLGEDLGILDFERGAKLAGARFTLYRGAGARLERALINFMLDLHVEEHKYIEMLPP